MSRLQGGVKPPHSKALRALGLVNQRDQLEGFQNTILRALAVGFEVAQDGQGILSGIRRLAQTFFFNVCDLPKARWAKVGARRSGGLF